MNRKLLMPAVFALTLSAASFTASAADASDALGEAADVSAATRTIVITPDTKWVNVNAGETVKFEAGGQEFAVTFDGNSLEGDLNPLAPDGALDHEVTTYVAPDESADGTGA